VTKQPSAWSDEGPRRASVGSPTALVERGTLTCDEIYALISS
jgi:hypothetical protein